jgi:methylenetetrahydrofolate--tRNA-(uracil-5-)-methyltransferase
MKPHHCSPASKLPWLGELVCSNSLRSQNFSNAVGMLKLEMSLLGSQVMAAAESTAVSAGQALAVDRRAFAMILDEKINNHPNINRQIRLVESLRDLPATQIILATGPLTHENLEKSLAELLGGNLHFYDAIAPVISSDSVDMRYAFWGNRYQEGGDYLNCPMNEAEWEDFFFALVQAPQVPLHDFEDANFFEGCLPLEVMAQRGPKTLLYGPMKPVGLRDPGSGRRPFAVLQLRKEDSSGQLLNLVGCQTKLTPGAQLQVFRKIPALRAAQFVRLGSVHRNTFINAPQALGPDLRLKIKPHIMVAGQLAGVEGYVESAACGLWAGLNGVRFHRGQPALSFPATCALGGLGSHLQNQATANFQPSNISWGLLPPLPLLPGVWLSKKEKNTALAKRALKDLLAWMWEQGLQPAHKPPVI